MASKRTKNFEAWLQSRGVDLRGAEIADDAENVIAGRGVVATESLKAGTELLRVPLSATFRRETSLLRKPLRKARLTGWLALAIALSHESRIHNSPFAPYLAFLPTEHELQSPILWSPEARALLEGTGLDVRSSPAAAEECYHDIVKPFFVSLPGSVSPPTLREFMRAGAVIAAYAFELGPGKETTLVPVADALNANASSPHTRLSVVENADALHMVLERDVQADTEVFNTYGIRAPSERLLRYGYLDVPTENDDSALLCSEILDAASEPTGLRLSRVRIAIRKLGEVGCIVWSAERKEAPFMSRERVLPLKRVQEAEEMFRRCGVGKNEVLAPALRARLRRIQCARPITKKGSHRARMALELRTGDQKRFEQALSALGLSPASSGKRSAAEPDGVGLSKD